jgi:beta-ureidopropionase / N-carbamoyl-L-amino-acid hydrolase
MAIALTTLNTLPADEFIATLATVFEHSPWVPERVAGLRPFKSTLQLHQSMYAAVTQASIVEQLALIRAHPELAGKAAVRGELTSESTREQAGAGLSACSPEEFAKLQTLNAAYATKFGFPFVLAVKGHNRTSVIAALELRGDNTAEHERAVALSEIGRIAGFRLADLIDEPLGSRIIAMCEQLAQHSEHPHELTCSYLSTAHRATAALIKDWMLAAGLSVHIDAIGNVIGTWYSDDNASTLLTGSHYDTVINAGKFDGRLGIVLPIAVVAQLRRQNQRLPYTLRIIAFAEEEGVRFKSTFLGSGAIVGRFDNALLNAVDANGISMRNAMLDAGLDPTAITAAATNEQGLLGFIEVHIEQGPVLLNEGHAVGVVTSIAGSLRHLVTITGLAGHSGTVPMNMRRDAAVAAAELILAVEQHCSGIPGLVGTVGQLNVPGGAINVIPGRCELSIDVRAADDSARDTAWAAVQAAAQQIAAQRHVDIQFRKVLQIDCAPCAPAWQQAISASIARITHEATPRHLPSGAGHDAMMMANLTDIGMLFVRCGNGGISHHPDESLTAADADIAACVFTDLLLHLEPQ